MDERFKGYKIGRPIPERELSQRLYIDRFAAPIIMDSATTYRINDTFMDVTDQSYLRRHFTSTATWIAIAGAGLGVYLWLFPSLLEPPVPDYVFVVLRLLSLGCTCFFGYMAVSSARDELFALSRRPIRFNRRLKKIYAIRNRRFFADLTEGDVVCEISWTNQTIFCVSAGADSWGEYYHIVCYEVDKNDNVVRALAIGRRWEVDELDALLAQWNYWCVYMKDGPAMLPSPMLYLAEKEDIVESFFICLYSFGFALPALLKIIAMPFVLPTFFCRRMSLATCREPRWPAEVDRANEVSAISFDEPSGPTPVGWKATIAAKLRRDWPDNPHCSILNWPGRIVEKNI